MEVSGIFNFTYKLPGRLKRVDIDRVVENLDFVCAAELLGFAKLRVGILGDELSCSKESAAQLVRISVPYSIWYGLG